MKKIIILLLASLLLASCGPAQSTALQASGQIEATEIAVAPELSGRVVDVLVAEGDSVKAGDPLLQAQKGTLEAGLDAANANLAAAQSALDMAQLSYDQTLSAALAAVQQTRITDWRTLPPDAFDQPEWYFTQNEQISAAQADVESAKAALDDAQANLTAVIQGKDNATFLEAEANLATARATFLSAREVNSRSQGLSDVKLTDAEKSDYDKLTNAASDSYDDARDALNRAQDTYDTLLGTQAAKEVTKARAKLSVAQERYYLAMDGLRALQTGADSPEVVMDPARRGKSLCETGTGPVVRA